MPDIEAMLTSSQRNVNGTAILKLRPYSFQTVGVDSPDALTKSKLGEYGAMQHGWTAEAATGFIKVSSTPLRVYYGMHPNEELSLIHISSLSGKRKGQVLDTLSQSQTTEVWVNDQT